MTYLYILLALILTPISWILIVPLYLRVNSKTNSYVVSQAGMLRLSYHPNSHQRLRLIILGINIGLVPHQDSAKKPTTKKENHAIRSRKSAQAWAYLIRGISNSFKLNKLICRVDFNDVIWNAYLFPICAFVSRGPVNLEINFTGQFVLDIEIRAHVYRLVWSFLRFSTKK